MNRFMESILQLIWRSLAVLFSLLLLLPFVILISSASIEVVVTAASSESFLRALSVSMRTSCVSLVINVVCGTPLAWWLSQGQGPWKRWIATLFEIPIVVPPAVVGLALLLTFGRQGVFGSWLESFGIVISFSEAAVVLAQIVVSAPFFITAARSAFKSLSPDLWTVARTLGASQTRVFFAVVIPSALPGLVSGAALAWARGLGEFGATLLFAGQLSGVTETLPLGIYSALESDLNLAIAYALLLGLAGFCVLVGLRLVFGRARGSKLDADSIVVERSMK